MDSQNTRSVHANKNNIQSPKKPHTHSFTRNPKLAIKAHAVEKNKLSSTTITRAAERRRIHTLQAFNYTQQHTVQLHSHSKKNEVKASIQAANSSHVKRSIIKPCPTQHSWFLDSHKK